MNTQPISLKSFTEAFKVIINQTIWRIIHPADGWLIIDCGQKYTDTVPGKNGVDEPYDKGQYQIYITGNWEIFSGNKLIATRKVNGANQKIYFDKIDRLIKNFPIRAIEKVQFNDSSLIFLGDNASIKVPISIDKDNISLTEVKLDPSNKPIFYEHYRFDEKLNKLACISTK